MKQKLTKAILTIIAIISLSIPTFALDSQNTGQTICANDFLLQLLMRQCGNCGGCAFDWTSVPWLPQQDKATGKAEQQIPDTQQPFEQLEQQLEQQPPVQKPDTQPESSEPDSAAPVRSYEQEVVRLVNLERAKNGLPALTEDAELSRIARLKSRDMHDQGYFDHTSPTYGTPFQMLRSFGVSYRSAGENIAMGYATPDAVVAAWMNSPGHRANILNASYTKIGVGLYERFWTQHFIG